MIEYRVLQERDIDRSLFQGFIRHQVVDQCLRKEAGGWVIKSEPFVDDWTEEQYQFLVQCLKNTVRDGGFVCGAFVSGVLKGFVAVESGLFGGENRYLDLQSLHVSEDMRRSGIGTALFQAASKWAKQQGAAKLYISAHSAIESQRFYRAMGCVEAAEYKKEHVEAEPYDFQMEYNLM